MTSLVALAPEHAQAELILKRLREEAHLGEKEVSVLLPGTTEDQDYGQVEELKTDAAAAPSDKTHAVKSGMIGALIGIGAVLIPGLQPLLLAGPAVALFGALVGTVAGGAVGVFIGLGIPDAEIEKYRERIKNGAFLIAVHSEDEAEIRQARAILEEEKAEEISETRDVKKKQ